MANSHLDSALKTYSNSCLDNREGYRVLSSMVDVPQQFIMNQPNPAMAAIFPDAARTLNKTPLRTNNAYNFSTNKKFERSYNGENFGGMKDTSKKMQQKAAFGGYRSKKLNSNNESQSSLPTLTPRRD